MYVWVKKPKEQVKPNIGGMRVIKSEKGGKLGNSIANETVGASWNTTDLEPGKYSNFICTNDSISPVEKLVRRASSCDDMHT